MCRILGGVSSGSILSSTEYVQWDSSSNKFVTSWGPGLPSKRFIKNSEKFLHMYKFCSTIFYRFGHCAILLPDGENVLLVGGFSEDNYVKTGDMYNIKSNSWLSKSYLKPKGTGRINHACGVVSKTFY